MVISFLTMGCGGGDTDFPSAGLVIQNAKIVTIDKDNPRAEAVAVKGDRIIAVGSDSLIEQYIDKNGTRVIDAGGRMVVPGFNDAHVHFRKIDPDFIDLRYVSDPAVITDRVSEKVAQAAPGELIRGGRWNHELFPGSKWPTRELIDNVSPENPVLLSRVDGHSVLVNSYLIRESGITADTPDPPGGEIVRDPVTGDPTGIFKETAKDLLEYDRDKEGYLAKDEPSEEMEGWLAALNKAARLGVTSIQHPGDGNFDIYRRLMDMGELTLRVDVSFELTDDPDTLAMYDSLRSEYPREGDWIRFGILKDFMDGTLGSATAMFFEPYEDDSINTGLPQMKYREMEKRVIAADSMGFQIGIHAIGSKANHWILNAYEMAEKVNGARDSRHRSEHAQILIDQDIPRFAELGVVASMQPTHCITDMHFCEKRIGRKRSGGAYAWKRLLDSGANIAFGTDYPVEPLDPLEGLYAAATRKPRKGGEGDGWFPSQRLSMEKAIELYTLGSAYAQFMEDRKGMIKTGYLADMVIFRDDLLTIPAENIMKAKVDYTIVGGMVVYDRTSN